ncbi:transcription factor HES-7-like [Nothobranchius furzeri]|uniref:Transcription factor HES-7-like n=2 Tax=Nothobranchius furzeri TaxID=105023 RepID=A0A9D3C3G8_NOTFU|nr:transcription factor HES-7-like [Nothobranchius furzeri]
MLKPVVEKKRRDRINQSLSELRSLLLLSTSDPRLQNPKIEKAEILDLAVEYLKRWTDRKNLRNESAALPILSMENAGFQQCVSQLSSYMHRISPAQRTHLVEGLKHHTENQRADLHHTMEVPSATSVDTICPSDSRLLFSSHSPFHPLSCPTPCHEYLSPPPSPWFSPPFPAYTSSPPFPSIACPFSLPPSLSPPSSNTNFCSFSPTLPHTTSPLGLHFPPSTSLRPPLIPPHREGSAARSVSATWRPWI